MVLATNLGFPRIGAKRELKFATENFWKGTISEAELVQIGADIRCTHWMMQKEAGIAHIPVNDFAFYDQMLDMTALLGAVPPRYKWSGDAVDMATYFAMARGNATTPAMEMTKWFDTNYHYIVPELTAATQFRISTRKIFDEVAEAKALGVMPRPVLIGPVTYLSLGKSKDGTSPLDLLSKILPVYRQILIKLAEQGVEWVQMDEPILALDISAAQEAAFRTAYATLVGFGIKICLTTYFEKLSANEDLALGLPTEALHIDLRRGAGQLDSVLAKMPADKILSLGLVDGRNIWRNNLRASLGLAHHAVDKLGADRVWIAPSCSLLHCPIDLAHEVRMDPQLRSWMAYAAQKLKEIVAITKATQNGESAIAEALTESDAVVKDRATSPRIHDPAVKSRMAKLSPHLFHRSLPFSERRPLQRTALGLPLFPTTTIGSFPQTKNIREARAALKKGTLDLTGYDAAMKEEIKTVVAFQDEIGLDVPVHGEPERNDMVEYFGEQLKGYTFSQNGWVQSYGTRCVKPPIIFGDVSRPAPMTVAWSSYAQSLTPRPMKGMLTGPITMLFWSFVRDDQPKSETCKQIALALRDEVVDLEAAGIRIIQIDEPAIREGLPLHRDDWDSYLKWAVESFRLSASGVRNETQIHTHMCYSEFNDIMGAIAALDADSISIETSRSQMELLEAFTEFHYPNEIGPGVYDIHSPRIPSVDEMVVLLEKAVTVLDPAQIWVNPDCGLKTRGWDEVKPALVNMVKAAQIMRDRFR
ncbi:MAG: 5-methyltetrahydropteroyltriglutamate--homocysteine S-methyltransferase [Alphaproteobacteria bacterium]|nr:5-methyltetrahydropteroyltriglutamate--homocysteine S-methyltransferase [Alphaproteobacteria bacterium]